MQIITKKSSVSQHYDHKMIVSVLKSISSTESQNDLNIIDEIMSEKISSDVFLISRFLLDSSCTSRNKSTVSQVLYVSMSLLILFQLTVEISNHNACIFKTQVRVSCIKCAWVLHSKDIASQCNVVFHNKIMYCKCKWYVSKEMTCTVINTLIRCVN